MNLTAPQRKLLAELPESPSDGKRCKGGAYITAFNLCRLKLARLVGVPPYGGSGAYFVRTTAGTAALAEPVEPTVDERTLVALIDRPVGPAFLSGSVWPGHIGLQKGAAPGTGLVRPMLAVLARLRKKGLVDWFSDNGEPVRWKLTAAGMTHLKGIGKWPT